MLATGFDPTAPSRSELKTKKEPGTIGRALVLTDSTESGAASLRHVHDVTAE